MYDQAFDGAVSVLCQQISLTFRQETRLVRAFGDLGAFATVMCALGICSIQRGQFTLASVQGIIVPGGWASSRRIRALIDWLELENAAQRHPPSLDKRERPWTLSGWPVIAVNSLAESYRSAASPWGGGRHRSKTPEHPAADISPLVDGVYWILRHSDELPLMSDEMRMFLGHSPGFPLLLELILETVGSDGVCEFSRKSAARSYGISRAHVTSLLAKAERLNYLKRSGSQIHLSDIMMRNVRQDIAYQLAFVVLWYEGVDT